MNVYRSITVDGKVQQVAISIEPQNRNMTWEDWEDFSPIFTPKEFACQCGKCEVSTANNMRHDFMVSLHDMRTALGIPFVITSGYRCAEHPKEIKKAVPGDHHKGTAADVAGSGSIPVDLVTVGRAYGMNVFGWHHKGKYNERFTHVAKREGLEDVVGYTY